jgi:hypothetical protein
MDTSKFIDNKWLKHYIALISSRSNRPIPKIHEKHHIIPGSMGGSDDKSNLVALTLREHYVAHLLLTKFTTGKDRSKMGYALNMMINRDGPRCSRMYEEHRIHAMKCAGKRVHTQETIDRIVAKTTGQKRTQEFKDTISRLHLGKKRSNESRERMSLVRTGLKHKLRRPEHNEKIGAAQRGVKRRPLTDEEKKNLSLSLRGQKREIVICPHCNKSGGSNVMKRWHFDECRTLGSYLSTDKN